MRPITTPPVQAAKIENHGVAITARSAVMREHLEAMKRLWCDERAAYSGPTALVG